MCLIKGGGLEGRGKKGAYRSWDVIKFTIIKG